MGIFFKLTDFYSLNHELILARLSLKISRQQFRRRMELIRSRQPRPRYRESNLGLSISRI